MNSLPFTINCSMLFTEHPMIQRPSAAKQAGFHAVEFWWPFDEPDPDTTQLSAFRDAIVSSGVQLTGINFYGGDMAAGERGILSTPGREREFQRNVDVAVDLATSLGCTNFNALYGRRIDGVDAARQDDTADRNLSFALQAVRAIGGVLLLEPLSGMADFPLRTVEDALTVLARIDAPSENAAVLLDIYHLAANGVDVELAIEEHSDRIGHVQIADHPGRHEPGTGSLPVGRWLDALHSRGYRGCVGLEYVPSTTTLESLQFLDSAHRGQARPRSTTR